jgi:DNA invertase Pin-like site-specific DNA recombinase
MQLIANGIKPTDIAKELNIGRSSVYRIIAEHDNQSTAG